jgi:hypothetical protein
MESYAMDHHHIFCRSSGSSVAMERQYRERSVRLAPSTDTTGLLQTNKLHGLSSQANYTDRATAACRRSDCQLLRIEGATWSA